MAACSEGCAEACTEARRGRRRPPPRLATTELPVRTSSERGRARDRRPRPCARSPGPAFARRPAAITLWLPPSAPRPDPRPPRLRLDLRSAIRSAHRSTTRPTPFPAPRSSRCSSGRTQRLRVRPRRTRSSHRTPNDARSRSRSEAPLAPRSPAQYPRLPTSVVPPAQAISTESRAVPTSRASRGQRRRRQARRVTAYANEQGIADPRPARGLGRTRVVAAPRHRVAATAPACQRHAPSDRGRSGTAIAKWEGFGTPGAVRYARHGEVRSDRARIATTMPVGIVAIEGGVIAGNDRYSVDGSGPSGKPAGPSPRAASLPAGRGRSAGGRTEGGPDPRRGRGEQRGFPRTQQHLEVAVLSTRSIPFHSWKWQEWPSGRGSWVRPGERRGPWRVRSGTGAGDARDRCGEGRGPRGERAVPKWEEWGTATRGLPEVGREGETLTPFSPPSYHRGMVAMRKRGEWAAACWRPGGGSARVATGAGGRERLALR